VSNLSPLQADAPGLQQGLDSCELQLQPLTQYEAILLLQQREMAFIVQVTWLWNTDVVKSEKVNNKTPKLLLLLLLFRDKWVPVTVISGSLSQ
jgi:hypothetical protein